MTEQQRYIPAAGHQALTRFYDPILAVTSREQAFRTRLLAAFTVLQLVDGFATTRDHGAGRLPGFIERAGFAPAPAFATLRTAFGSLELRTHAIL